MSAGKGDSLSLETQDIWNQNAAFWDSIIGDAGNRFHRAIVEPATLNLLALQAGESVLEIACGNGAFARKMAQFGVHVVASDFSINLLERAKTRTGDHQIEYVLIDATDEEQLLALGERRFDAAVCNMALMDMPAIDPLFAALSHLLKPGGRFVFSVQHPCFNSNAATKMVELGDRNGELVTIYAIKVSKYLTPLTERGIGIVGQPSPHYLFHRPISLLFNAGFRSGFVLDGLEEPPDPADPNDSKWSAWSNYKETPPALVARLRLGSHSDGAAT
jgi:2-polyprenyl-3-methyl-5-hydroxy-6-metoxy-1,4-benzoquinol methylase